MRKITILVLVVGVVLVFTGCAQILWLLFAPEISPPEWILGTWSDGSIEWTFTADTGVLASSTETIDLRACRCISSLSSDESYYGLVTAESDVYRFERLTDTTLNYTSHKFRSSQIGPILLTKI